MDTNMVDTPPFLIIAFSLIFLTLTYLLFLKVTPEGYQFVL